MKIIFISATLIILLLGGSQTVVAQQEAEKGTIITGANDSIQGYIISRTNMDLTAEVKFKKNINDTEIITYDAFQVKSFEFENGRRFDAFKISVSNESRMMFLILVVGGKQMNLYELQTTYLKSRYFIKKADNPILELKRSKKTIEKDGRKYAVTDREYVGILNYLLSDCITPINSDIPLRKKQLTEVVVDYNKCIDPGQEVYLLEKEMKTSVKLSFSGKIINGKYAVKNKLRGTIFIDRNNFNRSDIYSKQFGLSFLYLNDEDEKDKNEFLMFNVFPFQISTYGINNDKELRFYYETGIGIALGMFKDFDQNNEGEWIKDDTRYGVTLALNITGGIRLKLGKKTAMHLEVTPSLMANGIYLGGGLTF